MLAFLASLDTSYHIQRHLTAHTHGQLHIQYTHTHKPPLHNHKHRHLWRLAQTIKERQMYSQTCTPHRRFQMIMANLNPKHEQRNSLVALFSRLTLVVKRAKEANNFPFHHCSYLDFIVPVWGQQEVNHLDLLFGEGKFILMDKYLLCLVQIEMDEKLSGQKPQSRKLPTAPNMLLTQNTFPS